MKLNLNKYLLYSSVFAIFTEAFFFRFIIDLKLFYFILFINYTLLFIYKKVTINKFLIELFGFIFIYSGIAYIVIGIPPNYMFSQILGIAVSSVYFYNVLKLFSKEEIYETYAKLSLYTAIIGFPMFFLGINFNVNNDFRFYSYLLEPAHYAIIVLPACYYFLKKKKYFSFSVIFLTLILSESSIAYIGCALMFILPNITLKRIQYSLGVIPFVIGVFYIVYSNNEMVKTRFDDTYNSLKALNTGKFEYQTNVSTYALLSNLYVAKKNFIEHPLGSGIGSHYYMYQTHYRNMMRPPSYLITLKLDDINSQDAASLFFRLFSEFGILGILGTLFVLYFVFKSFQNKQLIIEQSISIYLLLKLFRDGHYFPPELYFFLLIFYLSFTKHILFKNEKNLSYS